MANPKNRPKNTSEDVPEVVGSQAAYERFLAEALKLSPAEVKSFRADALLAYHNVQRGVDALRPREKQIKDELPKLSWSSLVEAPELALGVVYAAAQIDRTSDGSTAKLLGRARVLRDLLLSSAEALAKASLLPAAAVAKIRAGTGPIDAAQDCVDLAALFAKHAAKIKGSTAVKAADLKEAAALGNQLLGILKPKRAKKADPAAEQASARDRLWTLLVARHDRLRRAGVWLWGEAGVDEHVPQLQTRVAAAVKKKKASQDGVDQGTPPKAP